MFRWKAFGICILLAGIWVWFDFPVALTHRLAGSAYAGRPMAELPAPVSNVWNFDGDALDKLPAGFVSERTGRGTRGHWMVAADATAPSPPNVLIQKSPDETDYRLPMALVKDSKFRDLKLSVRFKILSGKVDQSAGLVFRSRDEKNYYLLRASALDKQNQFRLYHVVDGRRTAVAGVTLPIPLNQWHTMAVELKDHHFRCYLNGQLKFEKEDKTITVAGKIGVWTKADSVACFDDLSVQANGQ